MLFGGLQKISLIDYPGKVSCVLFLSECNFACPYCHNPDLVKGNPSPIHSLDKNAVYDFLERRKEYLDGVVISGGEPTLQEDLISFCEKIKQLGYKVKLDTNGSQPQVLRQLIEEGIVDYVAMDIKTDPLHYSPFIKIDYSPHNILSSIQIIMESSTAYEFRTTCVKPIVNEQDIENIAKIIKGAMLYVLQRFHNTEVLNPGFFQETEADYDEPELMMLKSLVDRWVEKCIIR